MKKFAIVVLSVLLVCGGASFWVYKLDEQGQFSVQDVRVELTSSEENSHYINYYDDQHMNLVSDLESFKGQSLFRLPVGDISKKLKKRMWVKNILVHRKWPHSFIVQVETKKIVALVRSKTGGLYPMLEDANLLEEIQNQSLPDVPILASAEFEKDMGLRKQAIQFFAQIPSQGHFSLSQISEIIFNSSEGYTVKMLSSGLPVKMGQDEWATKASRLNSVIEYINEHKVDARVIDANLTKKVLVRLRKDP